MAVYELHGNLTLLIRGLKDRRSLLVFTALIISLLYSTSFGCYRSVDTGASAYGSTLTIDVRDLDTISRVLYSERGKHYAITPRDNQNSVVVARITLMNPRSARTSLLINEEAAYLSDDKYNNFDVLNPYIDREEILKPIEGEDQYLPFLWGTVNLKEKYQIQGWMFFEVPDGADLNSFYWEQADSVRIRLKGN